MDEGETAEKEISMELEDKTEEASDLSLLPKGGRKRCVRRPRFLEVFDCYFRTRRVPKTTATVEEEEEQDEEEVKMFREEEAENDPKVRQSNWRSSSLSYCHFFRCSLILYLV